MKFVTTAGSNIGSGHDEMLRKWTPDGRPQASAAALGLFHSRRDLDNHIRDAVVRL